MRALFRKRKTRLCLLVLAAIGLLLFRPIKKVLAVAAVQNAVQCDWEVEFVDASGIPNRKPAMLPQWIDLIAEDLFSLMCVVPSDKIATQSPNTFNFPSVHLERFRAPFHDSIQEIRIRSFEAFSGDLGSEFARFPDLRRVIVEEPGGYLPTESEWTHLCARLRELPHLEEIELGGMWVTDAAIAPLAGHPNLRSIYIKYGRLTDGCTKTFASIPHLSKLKIGFQSDEEGETLSRQIKAAIRAALPAVEVEFD